MPVPYAIPLSSSSRTRRTPRRALRSRAENPQLHHHAKRKQYPWKKASQCLWQKHVELESGIDDLFLNFYAMRGPDQWIPLEMEDPATEAHNGYAVICNRSHGLADD